MSKKQNKNIKKETANLKKNFEDLLKSADAYNKQNGVYVAPNIFPQADKCPNCGYCRHCGRGSNGGYPPYISLSSGDNFGGNTSGWFN